MRSSEEGAGAKPRVFDSIVTYLSTITIYTTHHRYKFTHLHHKHTSVFIVYKFKLLSTLLLFIIFTVSPPLPAPRRPSPGRSSYCCLHIMIAYIFLYFHLIACYSSHHFLEMFLFLSCSFHLHSLPPL